MGQSAIPVARFFQTGVWQQYQLLDFLCRGVAVIPVLDSFMQRCGSNTSARSFQAGV